MPRRLDARFGAVAEHSLLKWSCEEATERIRDWGRHSMGSARPLHELEAKLDQLLDGLRQQTRVAQHQTMEHLTLYSESLDELQVRRMQAGYGTEMSCGPSGVE